MRHPLDRAKNNKTARGRSRAIISITIAATLAFLTAFLVLTNSHQQQPKSGDDGRADPIWGAASNLGTLGGGIRTSLVRLLIANGLDCGPPHCRQGTPDDIFKVDLSLPGDESYGDNPALELFNPEGGDARFPSHDHLARFSTDPRFIFTIANSIKGVGTEKPDLLMVMTNPHAEVCEKIDELGNWNGPDILSRMQVINLTPFPEQPDHPALIELPEKPFSCIKTKDGLLYVHSLYER